MLKRKNSSLFQILISDGPIGMPYAFKEDKAPLQPCSIPARIPIILSRMHYLAYTFSNCSF